MVAALAVAVEPGQLEQSDQDGGADGATIVVVVFLNHVRG